MEYDTLHMSEMISCKNVSKLEGEKKRNKNKDVVIKVETNNTLNYLTDESFFSEPITDFPFDVILFSIAVSSSSGIDAETGAFCVDLFTNLFIICFRARGNCNQKSASKVSPKIAAAKANLTAQPLLTMVAYNCALSSSSMQP